MASRSIQSNRTHLTAISLALVLFLSLQPSSARLLRSMGSNNDFTSRGGSVDVATQVKESVAPFLLAMLPRGTMPPSGPSGGTNDAPGN
ncbi:hypothetical protein QOZ80_5AG0377510 [Eleusine coracana subsp. coracana]|nr:hypothetical protein QOZ80_5AG0377510 [Eleusine coracana subsp. coracana]